MSKNENIFYLRNLGRGVTYNNGSDREFAQNTGGIVIISVFVLVAIGAFIIAALCSNPSKKFNASLDKAKAKFEEKATDDASNSDGARTYKPHTGFYDVSCKSRYKNRIKRESNLIFTDIGNGYAISGFCKDINGCGQYEIKEGYCTYDGSYAYWIEHISDELVNQKGFSGKGTVVLNQGAFNFKMGTFEGKWVSNRDERGTFDRFKLKNEGVIAHSYTYSMT